MLDEDGIAGEVAMDDGRLTGVQEAGEAPSCPEHVTCAQPNEEQDG